MFGKLTWSAIPFHEPIVMVTSAVVALAITAVLAWVIVRIGIDHTISSTRPE